MRTNIDLDNELIDEAMRLGGLTTKKAAVEVALREFVDKRKRADLRDLFGKIPFQEGYDYKALRMGVQP
ncbi:MAG: type II toxin-antitoxin system VapB family antitoxin [Propionibacteriaceae bacterium]|jgi:Arc/MetJ family transcription regulator|nr:type II toxin-antitoxin system VapB family antitoxin [Propionibacteriaceae bacterium]